MVYEGRGRRRSERLSNNFVVRGYEGSLAAAGPGDSDSSADSSAGLSQHRGSVSGGVEQSQAALGAWAGAGLAGTRAAGPCCPSLQRSCSSAQAPGAAAWDRSRGRRQSSAQTWGTRGRGLGAEGPAQGDLRPRVGVSAASTGRASDAGVIMATPRHRCAAGGTADTAGTAGLTGWDQLGRRALDCCRARCCCCQAQNSGSPGPAMSRGPYSVRHVCCTGLDGSDVASAWNCS
jgi:hypothetical protein